MKTSLYIASLLLAPAMTIAGHAVSAQNIQLGSDFPTSGPQQRRVEQVSDSAAVQAGRPSTIEIAFRIAPGLHINSHTPHDALLIATSLRFAETGPVKVLRSSYPAGKPLRLEIGGGGEELSTYTGEFHVQLEVIAPRGEAVLSGVLAYQACDNHACFPPRSLPVRVVLASR